MRLCLVFLSAVLALAVGGCSSSSSGNPTSPTPSAVASTATPASSPSPARTYSHSELVRAAERILAASRKREIPPVGSVALRHDMTGVTAYFKTLPDDVDEMATTLADIAGVPVGVAQGDAPTPT